MASAFFQSFVSSENRNKSVGMRKDLWFVMKPWNTDLCAEYSAHHQACTKVQFLTKHSMLREGNQSSNLINWLTLNYAVIYQTHQLVWAGRQGSGGNGLTISFNTPITPITIVISLLCSNQNMSSSSFWLIPHRHTQTRKQRQEIKRAKNTEGQQDKHKQNKSTQTNEGKMLTA